MFGRSSFDDWVVTFEAASRMHLDTSRQNSGVSNHARIQGGAHRARPPPFSLEGIFLTLIIFAQGSK